VTKNHKHTVTIVIGVLTAMMVVCSQLFFFQAPRPLKKEIKTEKTDQQSSSERDDIISLPSFSQPTSAAHVEMNIRSFCLFEILFEENEEEASVHSLPLSFGKLLQTLFRVTISPNAP
jgi:hypothetical protein